jgi:putative molybdopterin biosynthesis protein
MASVEIIKSLEQIKLLSDPRRMAILRLLMVEPATLTQLGRAIGEYPAWIRHHLKKLEAAGLVEMVTVQVSGGFVEKYYQAKAHAFIFQEVVLPDPSAGEHLVLMGSHDLALSYLAERLRREAGLNLLILPVGSLEGLTALRQGLTHLTGCHLLDAESGEYNRPYIRHFFPDRDIFAVTLAHRVQGLLVAPGNPKAIHTLNDLERPDVVFINRNRGSGTRVWLDQQLGRLVIPAGQVRGYAQEVRTHTAVAQVIQSSKADTGLGLEAAALQAGVEFIPLFQERYDLVLPAELAQERRLLPFLDYLQTAEFRRAVEALGGYATAHSGELLSP